MSLKKKLHLLSEITVVVHEEWLLFGSRKTKNPKGRSECVYTQFLVMACCHIPHSVYRSENSYVHHILLLFYCLILMNLKPRLNNRSRQNKPTVKTKLERKKRERKTTNYTMLIFDLEIVFLPLWLLFVQGISIMEV